VCSHCRKPMHPHDVTPEPGPGARALDERPLEAA
jgi:hypothetical protein